MKGIILAAGKGTRLYPASLPVSKILLPVYDKPMIFYPLATLMQAGIKDVLIIVSESDIGNFKRVLGNGSQYGISISYKIQYEQKGIADALLVAEDFIENEPCCLILGDNIFYGMFISDMMRSAKSNTDGATVFVYAVRDPERFGIVELDEYKRAVSLEEKPSRPKSNYAVTGLYFYDAHACEYAKTLKPSARGELEVTDLNRIYLENSRLRVEVLERGVAWMDAGTHDSMLQSGIFVQSIELNTGHKIACLEEIAVEQGFITKEDLMAQVSGFKRNCYYDYIRHSVLKIQ